MSSDDAAGNLENICTGNYSWNEIFELPFDDIKTLHKEELDAYTGSKTPDGKRAHSQHLVLDVLNEVVGEDDRLNILKYLDQMIDEGLDPVVVNEIQELNGGAPRFSRIKTDKSTAKNYNDDGMLIEAARFYPGGTVVRTFHSVFDDAEDWELATRGQQFYRSLVDFIRDGQVEMSSGIAAKLRRAAPIRPLHSGNNVLHNVFVNGKDLQEAFSDDSITIDDRVQVLSEVTGIDLVTSYRSRDFMRTRQGRRLSNKGRVFRKPVFMAKDYRREVFEDILLKCDPEFRQHLIDKGVITTSGVLHDEKAFAVFYDAGDERSAVLDLIGIDGDSTPEQVYFTPWDLNLGNVMVTGEGDDRRYTHIDFERSRLETLESLLFKRWAQSGIYDHRGGSHVLEDGTPAEQALLDDAYHTVTELFTQDGKDTPSREEFDSSFRMNKRKQLLRIARRYLSLEKKRGHDADRMESSRRYFYTLFAQELVKDGKIEGLEDPKLDYLNSLFDTPLEEGDMAEIAERFNPSFETNEEVSPYDVINMRRKNDELIGRHDEVQKKEKIKRRLLRYGIPAAAFAVAIGSGIAAYGFSHLNDKVNELEAQSEVERWMPVLTAELGGTRGGLERTNMTFIYSRYYQTFHDPETAAAACLNLGSVIDAARESGVDIDMDLLRGSAADHPRASHMDHPPVPYARISQALYDIDLHTWSAVNEARGLTDNWMRIDGLDRADDAVEEELDDYISSTPEERMRERCSRLSSGLRDITEYCQQDNPNSYSAIMGENELHWP